MNRLRIAFAIASTFAVACGGTQQSADPMIHLSEDSYDFGQVALGELREHTFTISNVGGAALVMAPEVAVRVVKGC